MKLDEILLSIACLLCFCAKQYHAAICLSVSNIALQEFRKIGE